MRKLILTLIIFATQFNSFAQEADTSKYYYDVVAYWKKNEQKKYRLKYNEQKYLGDSLTEDKNIFDMEVFLKVVDSTQKSYDLEWKYGRNLKKDTTNSIEKYLDASMLSFVEKYNSFKVRVKTNEFGTMQSYENPDEINSFFQDLSLQTKKIVDKKLTETLSPKEREKIDEYVKLLLSKDILSDKMLYRSMQNMLYYHGIRMEINDTLYHEDEVPNFIESGTLKRDNTYFIESIDTLTNEVQFVLESFYKDEDIKRLTKKVFKDILPKTKSNKETQKNLDKLKFEVYIISRTWVDIDTGWTTFSKVTKITHIVTDEEELFKDEIVTFELLDE